MMQDDADLLVPPLQKFIPPVVLPPLSSSSSTSTSSDTATYHTVPQSLVTVQVGNGWEGLPSAAPFDVIHVGAAADTIPQALCQQLNTGGILIVPIGPSSSTQTLYKIERLDRHHHDHPTEEEEDPPPHRRPIQPDAITTMLVLEENEYRMTELLGVRYVPLMEQLP
jgi:protein-L-isoaspartate O-methyltransferase